MIILDKLFEVFATKHKGNDNILLKQGTSYDKLLHYITLHYITLHYFLISLFIGTLLTQMYHTL